MKKRFICFFIIVLLTILPVVYLFFKGITQAADSYAATEANQLLTYRVNECISKKFGVGGIKYKDITEIKTDNQGRIISIQIDTAKLNLIASEMTLEIIDSINSIKQGEFGIPLGNAFGNRLLAGRGPKLKVIINPFGTVANDIKSNFISAGINQTLHRISIDFKVCVSIMTPFTNSSSSFTSTLCIAETVIVGNVPNVIFGSGNTLGDLK